MQTLTIDSKTAFVFSGAESEAPIIYLNTFSGEGQEVYEAAQAAGCPSFTLVAISDLDWNHDGALGQSACFQKCRFLHWWCG